MFWFIGNEWQWKGNNFRITYGRIKCNKRKHNNSKLSTETRCRKSIVINSVLSSLNSYVSRILNNNFQIIQNLSVEKETFSTKL